MKKEIGLLLLVNLDQEKHFFRYIIGFNPHSGNFIIDDKQYLFNEAYRMNLFGYVYQNINILNTPYKKFDLQ